MRFGVLPVPRHSRHALLTIAIGTGATSAVFTVVNSVLLRPLPYRDSDRIALVWASEADRRRIWLSAPEIDDIARHARTLESAAGLMDLRFALTGTGNPEEVQLAGASPHRRKQLVPTVGHRRCSCARMPRPPLRSTPFLSAAGPWASPPLLSLSSSRARAGCLPGARLESIRQ